jgi:hypothetical protein
MTRREFLLGGVKAAATFLAYEALVRPARAHGGFLSGLRRGTLREARLDQVPHLDESLHVLAAYLGRYAPPPQAFAPGGDWDAAYDLIEWDGSPIEAAFYRRNRVIGTAFVSRRAGPDGIRYEKEQVLRLEGFESRLSAVAWCSREALPRLQEWSTRFATQPLKGRGSPLKFAETGVQRGGGLEISSASGVRRLPAPRGATISWAVLDALRDARADVGGRQPLPAFDLLHDFTSPRPDQRLERYGVLELSLDGRAHRLHGFVQTGTATEPTHFWVDEAGRPLLVTAGLRSLALVSVGA